MSALFASFFSLIRLRPIVSGCIVVALLLGGANYFLWKNRQVALRDHDEVRRKGETMLRALANRNRIDTDLGTLQAAIAQVERNLLDEASMEVNLGYFYKMEKPAHVRLVRLNQLAATPPPPKSLFKAVPFSMQVTGSYRNTMSFLRALETGPRLLRIRNCTFERNGTDSSELVLDLTIDVLAKL